MARLSREFYFGDTVAAAQALLGKVSGAAAGRHRWPAASRRPRPMWAGATRPATPTTTAAPPAPRRCFYPPGHAYVYLIYGMYHCLNFVTEPEGEPAAVLLRAVEPIAGIETIRPPALRGQAPDALPQLRNFLNGPGKVCRALA